MKIMSMIASMGYGSLLGAAVTFGVALILFCTWSNGMRVARAAIKDVGSNANLGFVSVVILMFPVIAGAISGQQITIDLWMVAIGAGIGFVAMLPYVSRTERKLQGDSFLEVFAARYRKPK